MGPVPDARLPQARRPGVGLSGLALAAAGLAIAVAVIGAIRAGPNGDSAWILYAAGRMLDGGRLYADLVEMNPPLVFWLHAPVVWTARLIHIPEWTVLVACVLAACLLAGEVFRRVLAAAGTERGRRWTLLTAVAVTAAVLPVGWFAQREHLLLVLVWPLLGVTIGRLAHARVPVTLAVAAGSLAGAGLALKPPALVLWPVLTALLMIRFRSPRAAFHPEQWAIAIVLAVYGAATLAFTPDFLPTMRRLAPLYLEFAPQPLPTLLFGGFQTWAVWAALLCWVAGGRKALGSPIEVVIAVSAAALFLAAVVQGKGFGYHYYPSFACAVALLVVISVEGAAARRLVAATGLVLVTALFTPVIFGRAAGHLQRRDTERLALAHVVADAVPAGGTLTVLSPRLGDAFPLVNQTGTTFALRYPHLWWLAALERLRSEGGNAAAAPQEPLEIELRRSVAADLAAQSPSLIIVRNPGAAERYAGDAPIDPIRLLLREPDFEAALSRYRPAGRVAGFDLYRLGPGGP